MPDLFNAFKLYLFDENLISYNERHLLYMIIQKLQKFLRLTFKHSICFIVQEYEFYEF